MAIPINQNKKNVLIATQIDVSVANRNIINIVINTDTVGSGTLNILANVGKSAFIDITQPIALATETNTIKAITGGPYGSLRFTPTPIAGKIETQTDFVFAATGKTITTVAGVFSGFADTDKITITGTTNNDGVYTITGAPTATVITVVEALVDETPGVSVSVKSFGTTTTYDIDLSVA